MRTSIPIFFLLGLVGCGHTSPMPTYRLHGIDFGQGLSVSMQQGIFDGCETARGFYTKHHTHFRYDAAYNEGWFLGRKKCEPLRQSASGSRR